MSVHTPQTFQFETFARFPLVHHMSLRRPDVPLDGDVGHSPAADAETVERNRATFLEEAGVNRHDLALGRQTHGTTVRVVTGADRGRGLYPQFDAFPATDGLATNDPAVAIGVIIADCVPLVLYDPQQHAVAVIHAGWRGTVGLIAQAGLQAMERAFGTRPDDLYAGIGPSIGPCCYEVGAEVVERWGASSGDWGLQAVLPRESTYHFDLWAANRLALRACGVPDDQIETSGACVRCQAEQYFSYRAARQGHWRPGRMMMVAQLAARACTDAASGLESEP
jgi:YfiH family protein